jgi:intracellular sulfur oxidation DsrE/DsrF family protein
MNEELISLDRRGFLGGVAVTAAAVGLSALAATPVAAEAADGTDFQKWLSGIKGKYRQVYDMPELNEGMGLIWSMVLQLTAPQAYGVTEQDLGIVVILRHNAIPLALNDGQWAKYKLGEYFKINDRATGAPATRNPFYALKEGEWFGAAAIDKLYAKGVKFGACNMAIMHYSGEVAKKMGLNAEDVRKDWTAAVVPGVDLVPSGVLALNGAQSKGCAYVAAG